MSTQTCVVLCFACIGLTIVSCCFIVCVVENIDKLDRICKRWFRKNDDD
jgi:hypothetical protein